MAGVQEYEDHPPVIPTQVSGPISELEILAVSGHAREGRSNSLCRIHQMDEGRRDDDPGTEVARKQVDIEVDPDPSDSRGHDGEKGCRRRDDQYDEQSGDSSARPDQLFPTG